MARSFSWAAAVAVAVLVLGGCGEQVEGKAATPADAAGAAAQLAQEVLVPVQTTMPARQDISAYFETTARVMAENRVEILSKGVGQCVALYVEVGDTVQEGQVLAELDQTEMLAQTRQTEVNVAQTKSQMDLARRMFDEGLGPEVEYTNTKFAYESAAAVLELQKVQLSHQTIRATITGVVTARKIQAGILVSTGMPTFSVVDPNSFILPISLPEKEMPRIKTGQTARVTIDSVANEEFDAAVSRINPAVDPASGTVGVNLRFEDRARPFLREASFARVRLVMETHANALVVPKDTLLEENSRRYLMIVQPETAAEGQAPRLLAKRVEVHTGLEDSNVIEIVSGIDDQTQVVSLGQHTLKPDSPVSVTTAEKEILSRAGLSADEALAIANEAAEGGQGGGGDGQRRQMRMRRR